MNRRKRGSSYEQAAAEYLFGKGYEIVATNYRYSRTEIDIICRKDNDLVFVEVKGQRSGEFGDAHYRVDSRKQKAIVETASGYLASTPVEYDSYRFDVIVVTDVAGKLQMEHLEGAFTL
jgi:putative endonuclease